jgi:hypothetical protein
VEGNKEASPNIARGHGEYLLGRDIESHDHMSQALIKAVARERLTRSQAFTV